MTNYSHLYKTAAVGYFSNQVLWQVSHISDVPIQKLTAVYSGVDIKVITEWENQVLQEYFIVRTVTLVKISAIVAAV